MSARNTFSIPVVPSLFDTFQKTVVPIFVAKAGTYGIPSTTITNIGISKIKWDKLVLICDADATKGPGAIADRNKFLLEYSDEISIIIEDFLLNNLLVTPADKLSFHIHILGGPKVPLPTPTSTVVAKISYKEPLAHYFSFTDSVTGKRARPKGVSIIEVRYKIDTVPPASVDDCNESIFLSRKKTKVLFTSADERKKAYYFARYLNKRGNFGPWCAMFSAGIV